MTVLSQKELAALYDVSTRQVRNWEDEGLPRRAKGNRKEYPLKDVVAWHEAREVAQALAKVDTSALGAAKLRRMEAEAEAKELDVAVKRGDLVPLDEVGDLVRESLQAVDSVLRHSPSRFAPALAKAGGVPPKVARTILREIVEMVRSAIREGGVGDDD